MNYISKEVGYELDQGRQLYLPLKKYLCTLYIKSCPWVRLSVMTRPNPTRYATADPTRPNPTPDPARPNTRNKWNLPTRPNPEFYVDVPGHDPQFVIPSIFNILFK